MSMATEFNPSTGRKADSARQYWRRLLSTDYGDAIIPIDYSGKTQRTVKEPLPMAISGEAFERLTKLTAGSPLLLYVALLTVLKVCLYKYSRKKVIAVGGLPRNVEGDSVKPSHVLAIVDQIDGRMSFRTLLLSIKETVVEAYQYQDYPLGDLIQDVQGGQERRLQPQVLLVVEDFHEESPLPRGDIRLRFEKCAAEVRGIVDFDHLLFSADLIQRFINDYLNILGLALNSR
jgi:fengycin family lipopeptide synthetase D